MDGRHNALERRNRLDWLEESADDPDECRVLTNAKCLTEGVDVPALDAVLFLSPRSSTIDIIQAVGRVMRVSDRKKYGYIIIPLVIKSDADVQTTLDDDETYAPVWDVVRALRAHDDRIDQYLISGSIPNLIVSPSPGSTSTYKWHEGEGKPLSSRDWVTDDAQYEEDMKRLLDLIRTKIAEKVGDRRYLESWAEDVAGIVGRIKERMPLALKKPDVKKSFREFHRGLKKIINDSVTEEEAIDMLAQHMIMGRVFDVLFADGQFSNQNPISIALNRVVGHMKKAGLDTETKELEAFYREIEDRISSIHTHEGRQRVLYELYDKFFKNAFKRTAERLGIVYTPVEIVDFVLKSADDVLYANFKRRLSGKNVHIIDPFVGTGTFISRLINNEAGLLQKAGLEHKFQNEIHANEIVLLAYYVAAVNCESALSQILNKYMPFDGLLLTDTFHTKKINEQWNEGMFTDTQRHIERQRKSPITVIVGNPPWSKGDKTFTGDPKAAYPESNARLAETYIKKATTHDKKSLYDSYIRAIRWASDRIGKEGIIAFVTNAGFLRSDTSAGMRVCLEEEFNEIWCFDLRGNQRTKGEASKQEGGKVFGSGSRASVAITILVKNPRKSGCIIRYKDIGDYLTRDEKLKIIKETGSIKGIKNWKVIKPDKQYNCWLDIPPIDTMFNDYVEIGNRATKSGRKKASAVFKNYSLGIATHRDAWVYNSSKTELIKNMKKTIEYCQILDPQKQHHDEHFVRPDSTLLNKLKKGRPKFNAKCVRQSMYRPFFSQWCYFDPYFVSAPYRIREFFPDAESKNIVICVPYKFRDEFYVFASKKTPDLHIAHTGQCFPFYVYSKGRREENITDDMLRAYQRYYHDQTITKKRIFTYVYGLLHHTGYQSKFASFLRRVLPRIPMAPNFSIFSNTGRDLMDLHLSYDSCQRHDLGKPLCDPTGFNKISFDRTTCVGPNGKLVKIDDKSVIKLDESILFKNVPKVNYRVNGRTPVEWIIDRYKIRTDKKSGIVNNPCQGVEIVAVLERAVHVGSESDRLIANLSKYEFESSVDESPRRRGLDEHM